MSKICFYYVKTKDTSGNDVMGIQCFCGTTACKNLPVKKPKEICMCCMEVECVHETVGCPWYVDKGRLTYLLEQIS